MRIEIDLNVANNPDAHRWLDRILYKVEDGWHVWDTTREPNPEAFWNTTWISDRGSQGQWIREMLVAAIRRATWPLDPHDRRVRVATVPMTTEELRPEDAVRLVEEPLTVLVENRYSDGAFVERVAKELDRGLRGLWDQRGEPVRLDSVGGVGEMLKEVERRSQKAPVRARLVVIVDSDRRYPGAMARHEARKLLRKCEELNLPCWVLAKRESENYLPRVLLSERENVGADHDQLVQAWDDLNDDQKSFYDMKDGLPETATFEEEALFKGLSTRARTLLSSGFGKNVYKCWTRWNVQAKTELLSHGQGDLESGIALIRKEV